MIALVLATVIVATPSPQPSPLKIITTVRASPVCATVRKLALPVGFISRRNDDAFSAINTSMLRFMGGIYPTDVPSESDLQKSAAAAQGDADPAATETGKQAPNPRAVRLKTTTSSITPFTR